MRTLIQRTDKESQKVDLPVFAPTQKRCHIRAVLKDSSCQILNSTMTQCNFQANCIYYNMQIKNLPHKYLNTRFQSQHGHYAFPQAFSVGGAFKLQHGSSELQRKNYKQVYFSCCLIFLSTKTSDRLKNNNFECQNLIIGTYSSLLKLHLAAQI